MIRRLVVCASLLAACHPAVDSPRAVGAECGAVGQSSPWCNGPFPGPERAVDPRVRRALIDALAAACPPPSQDDPTPGLSAGARALASQLHGRRRMIAPIGPEIDALERILAATPETSPDYRLILDRLAENYFTLERISYTACREARVPEVTTGSALGVEEDRVHRLLEGLQRGKAGAERTCASLARVDPDHPPRAPCPR